MCCIVGVNGMDDTNDRWVCVGEWVGHHLPMFLLDEDEDSIEMMSTQSNPLQASNRFETIDLDEDDPPSSSSAHSPSTPPSCHSSHHASTYNRESSRGSLLTDAHLDQALTVREI